MVAVVKATPAPPRTIDPELLVWYIDDLNPTQQQGFIDRLPPKHLALFRTSVEQLIESRTITQQTLAEAERYRDDPFGFVTDRLGEYPWSKQVQILESVRDNVRTVVPASFGVGKSFIAARTVAWFVSTRPNPLVVTSAPSFNQVKNILWRELGRAHRKGDLLGRCNLTDWVTTDGEVVAFGRKPADHDAESTFQGLHSQHLLVVLDEAGGIPSGLWDQTTKLMTNQNSRLLAIGNSDTEGSIFHQKTLDPRYNTITISAYDSPAFTGEPVPSHVLEELVNQEWVDDMAQDFGAESATFARRVLAHFVVDAADGVIPRSALINCQRHDLEAVGELTLGVDVSAGGDRTTIAGRRHNTLTGTIEFREADPLKQAHRVAGIVNEMGATVVYLDRIGVGHHLVGHLRDLCPGASIIGVSVAERSNEPERFPNLRSELWWDARIRSQNEDWDLSELSQDGIEELAAPKYTTDAKDRIVVEKKEDTIRRLGRSPDLADAVILAFYVDRKTGHEEASTAAHVNRVLAQQAPPPGPGSLGPGM